MRLIDADAIRKKAVPHERGYHGYKADIRKWAVLVGDIDDAPTIDAEVVVRCKDCVQWHRHCGIVDSPNGHCFTHDIEMNGYDFCSYGVRKDGVEDGK